MAYDAHSNLAYTLLTNSPGTAGTSFKLTAGTGAYFPAAPFNCTVWPANVIPTQGNAEIVRVTVVTGDTLTVTRAQEGSTAVNVGVGYQFMLSITALDITAIEAQASIAGAAPSLGQIAVGSAASVYAPKTMSGDATITSAGVISVVSSGGVAFGSAAFTSSSAYDAAGAAAAAQAASYPGLGTVPINAGGTGQTTANAALNALLPSQGGVTSGWVLQTNGTNTSWVAQSSGGSGVTSVATSAGLTGGTITTTGTLSLDLTYSALFTGTHTFNQTGLGNNATGAAVTLENIQTASSGNQQYSPAFIMYGQGWGTTGGASQQVGVRQYCLPLQAAAARGQWVVELQDGGGSWTNAFTANQSTGFSFNVGISASVLTSVNGMSLGSSNTLTWTSRSKIASPADGIFELTNNAATGFTRLQLGGTTSSFVALQTSGTTLTVGTADGGTSAGALTVSGLVTGNSGITTAAGATAAAGTWKLGALRTGTALVISTTQGIQLDVGGTLYTLAVLSTNP